MSQDLHQRTYLPMIFLIMKLATILVLRTTVQLKMVGEVQLGAPSCAGAGIRSLAAAVISIHPTPLILP